jgi:hypothetical protein
VSSATTVHLRRPGNPKKWRARVLCEGKVCDLALLTVDDDGFWSSELREIEFVDVPNLQVRFCLSASRRSCRCAARSAVWVRCGMRAGRLMARRASHWDILFFMPDRTNSILLIPARLFRVWSAREGWEKLRGMCPRPGTASVSCAAGLA